MVKQPHKFSSHDTGHVLSGAFRANRDPTTGVFTDHWMDADGCAGSTQHYLPSENQATGPMAPNPWPRFAEGRDGGQEEEEEQGEREGAWKGGDDGEWYEVRRGEEAYRNFFGRGYDGAVGGGWEDGYEMYEDDCYNGGRDGGGYGDGGELGDDDEGYYGSGYGGGCGHDGARYGDFYGGGQNDCFGYGGYQDYYGLGGAGFEADYASGGGGYDDYFDAGGGHGDYYGGDGEHGDYFGVGAGFDDYGAYYGFNDYHGYGGGTPGFGGYGYHGYR